MQKNREEFDDLIQKAEKEYNQHGETSVYETLCDTAKKLLKLIIKSDE